ncbi:MAG: hypothetical protein LBC86_01075 [Oscillospiraceae bacterium]|jgi:arsenate reductase-like glutaredoxin family protein|nr:hypothetical protein [Oscillospiraceae bacterium]
MGNDNNSICAYIDCGKNGCLILNERVCQYKKCSFFRCRLEYEKNKNRDYLYESYKKGNITKQRYIDLCKIYPACNRKILAKGEK